MNRFWFAICLLAISTPLSAQISKSKKFPWQPSEGHTQVPIWPVSPPDPQPVAGPEFAESTGQDHYVAGKPWTAVSNVSQPTMTVYPAKGKNTSAAVIVFPGGGYQILAIDLEGSEVCDWLSSRGITCILLKYRVTKMGAYPKSGPFPESPMALEDAQRTVSLVRFQARQLQIDPAKIGVLGFSAGGHLVAAISNHYDRRLYPSVDAADSVSCRPDFAVAMYPGHLSIAAAESDAEAGTKKFNIGDSASLKTAAREYGLNPDLHVTAHTPPTFLMQNEDDHVDNVDDALSYYIALKKADVPVEMHLYAQGGHGFGLRRTMLPVTAWPQLVETWLHTVGVIRD